MGSFGRREPFPSSDVDCALAWEGPDDDGRSAAAMGTLAERVLDGLAACGFEPDEKGAVASSPLFARSIEGWEAARAAWIEEPDQRSRADAAVGGGGERCGLGLDRRGRADRRRVRRHARARAAC